MKFIVLYLIMLFFIFLYNKIDYISNDLYPNTNLFSIFSILLILFLIYYFIDLFITRIYKTN